MIRRLHPAHQSSFPAHSFGTLLSPLVAAFVSSHAFYERSLNISAKDGLVFVQFRVQKILTVPSGRKPTLLSLLCNKAPRIGETRRVSAI